MSAFQWTEMVKPICERCGHEPGYHGVTYCMAVEAGYGKAMEQRRVCDCPGWKRDEGWPPLVTVDVDSGASDSPEKTT